MALLDAAVVTLTAKGVVTGQGARINSRRRMATNLIVNPSFGTDLVGWLSATAVTRTRSADWSWEGGWSMRCQGSRPASGALAYVILPGVGVPGKTIGFRLTANVLSNPGGLRLMAQTVNAAGTVGSPYVALTPAARDPGIFNGTGEWEWRGLYTMPADAHANVYLFFTAVTGGTADVYIDAALASLDLIDRNINRPVEGLDVPPYGDGDDPEWEWLGTPHASQSRRKPNKVNWVRNPSVELDATKMAGYKTNASLAREALSRSTPTRITTDGDEGGASAEWSVVASATGQAILYLGDPEDVAVTGARVHNQEITVVAASIKASLPPGATVYLLVETFLKDGTRAYAKGYQVTPDGSWQRMSVTGMEEFPADAGVTSVANRPPRWALGAFWLYGLPAGWTGTVKTDRGLIRRDHLGVPTSAPRYFDYFDGDDGSWLGTPQASSSAMDTLVQHAPPVTLAAQAALAGRGAIFAKGATQAAMVTTATGGGVIRAKGGAALALTTEAAGRGAQVSTPPPVTLAAEGVATGRGALLAGAVAALTATSTLDGAGGRRVLSPVVALAASLVLTGQGTRLATLPAQTLALAMLLAYNPERIYALLVLAVARDVDLALGARPDTALALQPRPDVDLALVESR